MVFRDIAKDGTTRLTGGMVQEGVPGRGIATTVTTYQVGGSATVPPTGSWVSNPPATSTGQYLWTRNVFNYTDGTSSTSYSVAAHGSTGNTGSQGTRWGSTPIAVFGTATNCSVNFPDGNPPRIGDWVVSTNGLTPGAAYKVTAVVDSTHADLDSNDGVDLRGPQGPAGSTNALNAYPVGAIYMSVVDTSPATLFGGTWAVWGTGRVPVAIDTSQTEFNTVEKTGGEKAHTLTAGEMPNHGHFTTFLTGTSGNPPANPGVNIAGTQTGGAGGVYATNGVTGGHSIINLSSAGSGGAHNNLQPYITCYMWKRTA